MLKTYYFVQHVDGNAVEEINDQIEKEYKLDKGNMSKCAETVARVNRASAYGSDSNTYESLDTSDENEESENGFDDSVGNKNSADNNSSNYARDFEKIEDKNPELLTVICVRKARIKADVLAANYSPIVKRLNPTTTYHELMIAAELYMSGFVSKRDFPNEYQMIEEKDVDLIKQKINKISSRQEKGLTVQEQKRLRERVDAINNQLDDTSLLSLKQQLLEDSENQAGTDRTKVFLEISKIENYFANETSTENYLNKAIYDSVDCKDDSYVSSMMQIISIINNDKIEDSENIKNVSTYVNNVLDHSLTVPVEAIISPQNNMSAADSSIDNTYTDDTNNKELINPFALDSDSDQSGADVSDNYDTSGNGNRQAVAGNNNKKDYEKQQLIM